MAIKLFVDATADLQRDFLRDHPEITVIDTPIWASSKTDNRQFDNLGPDDFIAVDRDFFRKGYRITTSNPPILDPDLECEDSVATQAYQAVKAGYAVLYLAMGGGMSGTYSYAKLCFDELCEDFDIPEQQLQAIDTMCMSTGTAMLVSELYDRFDLEHLEDVSPLVEYIKNNRGHIAHFFTWQNLNYIVKSGRVSALAGKAARFLRLLPIGVAGFNADGERKLDTVSGLNSPRSLNKFAKILAKYIEHHLIHPDAPITVAYANNPDAGFYLATALENYLPRANIIGGYRLGAAIQAHGGPTSLHVNFHANNAPTIGEIAAEIADIMADL